jgi:glycosyltransferase involved in cell wall biosynthesis
MSTLRREKRLSVLIPAYEYVDGVKRILSNLCATCVSDIEILIVDDSETDQVRFLVEAFSRHCPNKISYMKSRHRRGAVSSWNSLIGQATGEYVVLLHHDEFPMSPDFVPKLLEVIEKEGEKIDVFVMDCILTNSTGEMVRPHLPRVIRRIVPKYIPEYMLKRNVIGSASCLVVRRELYPLFDDKLKWLVDVDVYFRLRRATNRWCMCNDLKIGSVFKRDDSITASIKDEIKSLESLERKILINKYPDAGAWIDTENNKIRYHVENAAWIAMRVATRIFYNFGYKSWRR